MLTSKKSPHIMVSMELNSNHKKPYDIPKLILAYRNDLGLTQEAFASRFKVTRQAVSYWEAGMREAPYVVLMEVMSWLENGGKDA